MCDYVSVCLCACVCMFVFVTKYITVLVAFVDSQGQRGILKYACTNRDPFLVGNKFVYKIIDSTLCTIRHLKCGTQQSNRPEHSHNGIGNICISFVINCNTI